MQAAVDPDDRLALARQRPGLLVGQPVGPGQPRRDLPVPVQLGEVAGR
jgi:hypothetical protein